MVPPKLATLSFVERLAHSLLTTISNPLTLGKRLRLQTLKGHSPEQLERELRSGSTRCVSQSASASPCWFSLTYFPLSKQIILIGSPVALYYLQKQPAVKGG